MLLGIMSDSHDDMQMLQRAVALFNGHAVQHVLHAGDFVSPFTFEALSQLQCPLTGVFGNNDGDRLLLGQKSDGSISTQPLLTEFGSRKIVIVHEPAAVEALARSEEFDLVVYGHTHEPDIRKVQGTLVVNPGKTARLHKGKSTVVILNTATMEAETKEL